MKLTYSILGLTAGAALLLASGCSKDEQPTSETPKMTPPASGDMQKAAESPKPVTEPAPAAAVAVPDASQAPPAAAAAAAQAVPPAMTLTDAAAAVATAPAAMSAQAQGLIEKAQALVTDQKYQEALPVVQQLSSLTLTPEQRTLVDGLKTQIQAALAKATATDPASALGNALGGKK